MADEDKKPEWPRYYVTWKIERPEGGLLLDQIPEDYSAAESLVTVSILYPPNGYSAKISTFDGKNGGQLSEDELFKVTLLMIMRMARSEELSEPKKALVAQFAEMIRLAFGVEPRRDPSA